MGGFLSYATKLEQKKIVLEFILIGQNKNKASKVEFSRVSKML